MKIVVYYNSGRIDEWDSDKFCASEPFKAEGQNIMSRFMLRTDKLETWGIVIELLWYDKEVQAGAEPRRDDVMNVNLHQATLKAGRFIPLVSPHELDDLAMIFYDGSMVIWKQGDDLVNGIKFAVQEILCFSNATSTSINSKAVGIFDYIQKANPGISDEESAALLGYKMSTLEKIIAEERANVSEEEDDDSDWMDEADEDNEDLEGGM